MYVRYMSFENQWIVVLTEIGCKNFKTLKSTKWTPRNCKIFTSFSIIPENCEILTSFYPPHKIAGNIVSFSPPNKFGKNFTSFSHRTKLTKILRFQKFFSPAQIEKKFYKFLSLWQNWETKLFGLKNVPHGSSRVGDVPPPVTKREFGLTTN